MIARITYAEENDLLHLFIDGKRCGWVRRSDDLTQFVRRIRRMDVRAELELSPAAERFRARIFGAPNQFG